MRKWTHKYITALAELCYQRRHPESPIAVPTGVWKHTRSAAWTQKVLTANETPQSLNRYQPSIPAERGFELSCAFAFYNQDSLREVDWVCESSSDPTAYLRILAAPTSSDPSALKFPPVVQNGHPSKTTQHSIRGRQIFHAFVDERYGQHEAVWKHQDTVMMAICKPTASTSSTWFLNLMEKLL